MIKLEFGESQNLIEIFEVSGRVSVTADVMRLQSQ